GVGEGVVDLWQPQVNGPIDGDAPRTATGKGHDRLLRRNPKSEKRHPKQGQRSQFRSSRICYDSIRVRPATNASSSDAENAARLLVSRFQIEGHGEVIGEPERQRWERLAHGKDVVPVLEVPDVLLRNPAAGGGIEMWRFGCEGFVRMAELIERVGEEVEM